MYCLRFLGGASIESETGAVTGSVMQRRRLGLLALAAASPLGSVSRDRAAALLFPEADAESARHAVSNALHAIRRALGKDAIVAVGDELRLNPTILRSDIADFDAAIAAGERERAVGLYRGPFLDGFFVSDAPEFERWVEGERQRLARAHGRVLEQLAESHEARGDFAEAAEWWRRLAACEPLSSRVAVRTMRALDAAGDAAAALQHARMHEEAVRGALEIPPDAEVTSLAARLRSTPRTIPRTVSHTSAATTRTLVAPAEPTKPAAAPEPAPHATQDRRWRLRVPLLALALLGTAGALAWSWSTDAATGAALPPIRSVAVLPLANLSGDTAQEYLALAMTDALITELARLRPDLRIVSRSSASRSRASRAATPEIARTLGVDAVVDGSVIREGGRVRVSIQLVHATDRHLWAERYDREFRHLLSVQANIAGAIAREIGHRVSEPGRPRASAATVDPAAHEAYLRGREALLRNSMEGAALATTHFQRAIAADSTYAPAWAGLADAHVLSALTPRIPQGDSYALAKAAAQRALALDDQLAEAHVAYGNVLKHEGDAAGAEAGMRRAIQLDPNHARARQKLGELLVERGQAREAIAHLEVARSFDPLSPVIQSIYGWALASDGQHDSAITVYRRVLEQDSTHVLAHSLLGTSLIFSGRYDEALAAMRRFERTTGVKRLQHVGVAYARSGRRAEAWQTYRELEQRRGIKGSYALAVIAAHLGDRERALRHLERERRNGSLLLGVRHDPWLAPLRGDPRFERFVESLAAR